MIIDVLRLRRANKQEEIYTGEMNIELSSEEARLIEPLKYEINAKIFEDEVLISGEISTFVELTCVRCLEKIDKKIDFQIETAFLNSEIFQENELEKQNEHKFNYDDTTEEELIDNEIDLHKLIKEYLILNLPEYPKCDYDCISNSLINKYKDDGIDPRWKKLLDITKN